jgi:hypothetical protein
MSVDCVLCAVMVQVSAADRSLVQRSLNKFGVPECDREASSTGSNPAGGRGFLSTECCVMSGTGLSSRPITHPEES